MFIGIDLGMQSVKVVRIQNMSITEAFMFPTPLIQTDPPKLNIEEFIERIKTELSEKDLKSALIGINIPPAYTNALVIDLPRIRSKRELDTAALTEAKRKMVPTPGPGSVFESLIIDEIFVAKVPRYEVMVIKSEKDFVSHLLEIFSRAGNIHPALISPNCAALINAFPPGSAPFLKDTAFIDLGYHSLEISIVKQGTLCFYRNVNFGLKDIFIRMAKALSLNRDQVSQTIRDKGVPQVDFDFNDKVKLAEEIMRQKYEASSESESEEGISSLELRMHWNTEIERIMHEIRRTLIFYNEQFQNRRVENLFFLGGGAQISGLVPEIMKKISGELISGYSPEEAGLQTPVKTEFYFKENIYQFLPALALALTAGQSKKKKEMLNFLPLDLKMLEVSLRRQIWGTVGAVCVSALFALGLIKIEIDNSIYRRRLNVTRLELKRTKEIRDQLKKLKKVKQNIYDRFASVRKIEENRFDCSAVLDFFSRVMPSDTVLTSLSIAEKPKPEESRKKKKKSKKSSRKNKKKSKTVKNEPVPPRSYELKAEFIAVADYSRALAAAENIKAEMASDPLFRKVSLSDPCLEKVYPLARSEDEVVLTREMERVFSLKAEISGGKK